jgi:hypothetical protein
LFGKKIKDVQAGQSVFRERSWSNNNNGWSKHCSVHNSIERGGSKHMCVFMSADHWEAAHLKHTERGVGEVFQVLDITFNTWSDERLPK